ncbi:zf-HC2 domain-containing protein [Pontimonas sp.]|jgi:anti-sigma factor (TIGR02949 family)|uniref:zf-HC2 domain-containing protein n=1 Tax=Pontimonas sp. TaxID=2304492 RepID=UPI002870081F|nr:zf-HC2 domain-containing protein [Pontimonas sp.]MDR9396739.1 alpha-ketoglutarate decarboxylase [Pontimonas sp.]MDR9434298.1 alpha-ketoglutarate decarboxylase [Pontimonas sp.]
MADCGCDKARVVMEDYLHGETDEHTGNDVAEHLACCPPCEDEWRVGQQLSKAVQRACCEEAPADLKTHILQSLTSTDNR